MVAKAAPVEKPDWCRQKAQDEAFTLLRSSLTMQAVLERREQDDAITTEAARAAEQHQRAVLSSPRVLRSGHNLDPSGPRRRRRGRAATSQPARDAQKPPPVPTEALPLPGTPEQLLGMFVLCWFDVDKLPQRLAFAGVIRDVAPAPQTFTVDFQHEAFLRIDHSSETYELGELNTCDLYLIERDHAVGQWRARARALDANLTFKRKDSLLCSLRRVQAFREARSLVEVTVRCPPKSRAARRG